MHVARPLPQVSAQAPSAQTWPPGHVMPQPPQFARSVATSVQVMPHCCWPMGQLSWHRPATHSEREPQTLPHAPQLDGSTVRSAQVAPQGCRGCVHVGVPEV
jgi:hypothetical protein